MVPAVSSGVGILSGQGAGAGSTASRAQPVRPNLSLIASAGSGERLCGNVFVDVDGLSMLAEVVKSRESSITMTLKRALSCMLPDVTSKMFTPSKAEIAGGEVSAEEFLALLLLAG